MGNILIIFYIGIILLKEFINILYLNRKFKEEIKNNNIFIYINN